MNIYEMDILNMMAVKAYDSQRSIAEACGYSLGMVNRSIKTLCEEGYLTDNREVSAKARELLESSRPKSAVILAAGVGMRMVPINMEMPKALLEVHGERLIERAIRQLKEAGITSISIVVGFMKEKFEYLIDKYDVELVVNADYARKNNLHSLLLVADRLANSYIVPCDLWCMDNPYQRYELYSWYMVSDTISMHSDVRVNRKRELVRVGRLTEGNQMLGITYVTRADAKLLADRLERLAQSGYDELFWEEAAYGEDKMMLAARVVPGDKAIEINTYEELREFDSDSKHLKTDAIQTVADALHVRTDAITDICVMKKGMTNRSFECSCKGQKYIMRIPGEGTDQLINRHNEASVYRMIADMGFCDNPVYINADNGYKLTTYLNDVRVCDETKVEDLTVCMRLLRKLHDSKLQVEHTFDFYRELAFYESLWDGRPSAYDDYEQTKQNVLALRGFIEQHAKPMVLTHIDANQDNFLFYRKNDGSIGLQLTDWEYASMQDPDVDLAMFCIYAMYDRYEIDRLIDIYYEGSCDETTRTKIYCYIATCGLLWSVWCEYKSIFGVEFGEYALRQYRYAKEYYKIATERIGKKESICTR